MTSDRLLAHLQVDRYGDFQLTEAVRPSVDLQVVPRQGYRVSTYCDPRTRLRVPVLGAAVSRESLFETFLALLEPLGPEVDVVLETSHDSGGSSHRDLVREHIDLPVLTSHLCEFEDLLLNDGCAGVAVIARDEPIEVQFDEHKLLVVYARALDEFETVFRDAGVPRQDRLRLLIDGEHMHGSDPRHRAAFEQLCQRLGVSEAAEHVSW